MNETIDKLKELLENDKKIIEENYKEIERQKEIIRQLDIKNLELEIIIKEVREYITYARTPRTIYESGYGKGTCVEICMEHLLEILDKGE